MEKNKELTEDLRKPSLDLRAIGGFISVDKASKWTAEYHKRYPRQIKGHFFGRDIIERLLKQTNCVGIRMYYGIHPDNIDADTENKQLMLVGVDKNNDDILGTNYTKQQQSGSAKARMSFAEGEEEEDDSTDILEDGVADMSATCPNQCGSKNPVNNPL